MGFAAMKWARRQRIHDGVLLNVLKRLSEIADKAGSSWASQATIATACGLSERSLRRALRLLDNLGVVARTRRSRGHLGRTTDLAVLALHREFEIPRSAILRARAKTQPRDLQPDTQSVATGPYVRGIIKRTTYPIQGEGTLPYQGMALGPSRPILALVGGTSIDGEDAA